MKRYTRLSREVAAHAALYREQPWRWEYDKRLAYSFYRAGIGVQCEYFDRLPPHENDVWHDNAEALVWFHCRTIDKHTGIAIIKVG